MHIVLALGRRKRAECDLAAVAHAHRAHARARRAQRREHAEIRRQRTGLAALGPHRNAMTPPQLARDAPIADVLVPRLEILCVSRRKEAQFAVAGLARSARDIGRQRAIDLFRVHRTQRSAAQAIVSHAHIPLVAQIRFNGHMRSIAVANGMAVRPDLFEQIVGLEPRDNPLARVFTRKPDELLGFATNIHPTVTIADRSIGRHDVDRRQTVTLSDVPVVLIVRGRDLQKSRGKLRLGVGRIAAHRRGHHHIVVLDDGDLATDDGKTHLFTAQRSRARILGIERNGAVTKHRLGPSGGNGDMTRSIGERIAEVPKAAVDFLHLHFIVGDGGLRRGIPVHQSFAAVNEPIFEQREKRRANRSGASLIHGEARAIEIA